MKHNTNTLETEVQLQERRFHALVEHSSENVIVISENGTLLYFTPSAEGKGILGYKGQKVLGANVFDFLHPQDREEVKRLLALILANPSTNVTTIFRARHIDGSWRYLEALALNRVTDETIQGIVVHYRDITDRIHAQERQKVLIQALSDLNVGIVFLRDMRIEEANDAFCLISGYSKGELSALASCFELIAPEERDPLARHLQRHMSGRLVHGDYELTLLHKTGKRVALEVSMKSVLSERPHLIALIRDVTERKEAEKTRLHARDAQIATLQNQVGRLRRRIERRYHFEHIIGRSPAMDDLYARMEIATEAELTVLITGETGTGKELVAKAIHFNSARRTQPLKERDCATLPRELAASLLFGYPKGAFTGAYADTRGPFEEASGGTLILDEIGEMPLDLQPTLLRVLQERKIQRVGETKDREVDVRIIAITNRDLESEVHEGRFRADLYYRLCVFPIHVPPLRERHEDIPLLAEHFLSREAKRSKKRLSGFEPDVLDALQRYNWPGNVRELEHAVTFAAALAEDGGRIEMAHLPVRVRGEDTITEQMLAEKLDYATSVSLFRRRLIEDALRKCGGNRTQAAKLLGMQRTNLVGLIRQFHIEA